MPLVRLIVGALFQPAFFAVPLFGSAETLAWWRAWVVIGVVFVATVGSMIVLARESPALLAGRFESPLQRGQLFADKLLVLGSMIAFMFLLAFIAEDVFRSRVFARPGFAVATLGMGAFMAGWWIVIRALAANPFALPVVKPQQDRRQRAIDHGPYAVVRHPMYAGIALVLLGMPLWLESYAGALIAFVPIATLLVRIAIEERFLRRELAGYAAYTERVRFRMIPRLW